MSNQSNQSYSTDFSTCNSALAIIAENAVSLQVATICGILWAFFWLGFDVIEPDWYQKLSSNKTNRNHVVGLVLGLAFKLVTVPSCALAAYMTPSHHDVAGTLAPMNVYQQVCWGSRGSTVIFELYHFAANMELVMHHGLILVTMTFLALFNGPHRTLDLSLGALVSEFPSMTYSFISRMGWAGQNPRLEWALLVAGALLTLAVRVPSVFVAMAMIPESGMRGGPGSVVFLGQGIYLVYNLNISLRRLKKANIFKSWTTPDRSWDFGIRIGRDNMICSTAFFFGLTMLTLPLLLLAFYSTFDSATPGKLICAGFGSMPIVFFLFLLGAEWGYFEPCVKAIMSFLESIQWIDLGTFARWSASGWIVYIAILVSLGETPDAHNKDLDPRDIVASRPLFCELVQTWEFWIWAPMALICPMVIVQCNLNDIGSYQEQIDKLRRVKEAAQERKEKGLEVARTPAKKRVQRIKKENEDARKPAEKHVQSIKEEDEDVWTPDAQMRMGHKSMLA